MLNTKYATNRLRISDGYAEFQRWCRYRSDVFLTLLSYALNPIRLPFMLLIHLLSTIACMTIIFGMIV